MRLAAGFFVVGLLAGCSADVPAEAGLAAGGPPPASIPAAEPVPRDPVATPVPPPARNVRVEADPAPPFTYWAPAGSVIRNHPTNPGIWLAEVNGRQTGYYFGDRCRASEYQGLVGRPVRSLPDPPPANWRVSCETCPVTDDLRPDRLNVVFDRNEIVTGVSCG